MTSSVKNNFAFQEFLTLSSTSHTQIKHVFHSLTRGQVRVLCEYMLNIRYRKIDLTKEDITKLKRKKNIIIPLSTKTTPEKVRKQLLKSNYSLIVYLVKKYLDSIRKKNT